LTCKTISKILINVANLRTEAIFVGAASSRDQSFRANSFRGWKPLPQKNDLKLTTPNTGSAKKRLLIPLFLPRKKAMPFEKQMEEFAQRRARALQMGGDEKIGKQHDKGRLTARERIDQLLDPGSFLEVGMLNLSDMPGMEENTPADSKVAGYGTIDGRRVAVISNDFTVLADQVLISTSRI
jgi:hypothetical protein